MLSLCNILNCKVMDIKEINNYILILKTYNIDYKFNIIDISFIYKEIINLIFNSAFKELEYLSNLKFLYEDKKFELEFIKNNFFPEIKNNKIIFNNFLDKYKTKTEIHNNFYHIVKTVNSF